MDQLIEKFKALGDKTRFQIYLLLAENQICVGGLAKALGITESAVSQHLKVLKSAGLIKGEKTGHFVHYHVQAGVIKELGGILDELSKDTVDIKKISEAQQAHDFDCTKVCEKTESCAKS
ncbi:MAG: metalloregulator ArsR/SmtB family transcription factor [Eubacteriales bacterium]